MSDCTCATHDGPHAVHLDALWHARNRAYLARLETSPLALAAFLREEIARLDVKAREIAWGDYDGWCCPWPAGDR